MKRKWFDNLLRRTKLVKSLNSRIEKLEAQVQELNLERQLHVNMITDLAEISVRLDPKSFQYKAEAQVCMDVITDLKANGDYEHFCKLVGERITESLMRA